MNLNDRYVISFEKVTKTYPYYGYILSGFKNFLLKLPQAIRNSRKRFVALRDISFKVYEGECFGIIGKNGAGKSTILSLILGVIKPDKGRIYVKKKVSALLELGAGFHPDLTGKENIILNGVLLGMRKRKVIQEIKKIIEFSELGDFINQPIRTYSLGMIARLGFSVVAHLEPEILLIDEVLAVGDIGFQKKCIDKILSFKQNRVTIVFVSHNMQDIKNLCDRVMWIEDHTIKMIGSPDKVIKEYEQNFKTIS